MNLVYCKRSMVCLASHRNSCLHSMIKIMCWLLILLVCIIHLYFCRNPSKCCSYNLFNLGVPIHDREWTKAELSTLWTAANLVIATIHRRGIVITDLKVQVNRERTMNIYPYIQPAHFILTPFGLCIVDFGCSYSIHSGRSIELILCDPIFSSTREFTNFADPVSRNWGVMNPRLTHDRDLLLIGNPCFFASTIYIEKHSHG